MRRYPMSKGREAPRRWQALEWWLRNAGEAATRHQSNFEEIPHVQEQRSPNKMVGAGAAAAQHWSDFEEIPHVQKQRSPNKKVGAGAAAAQHWSDFEEIPHVQGQRTPARQEEG